MTKYREIIQLRILGFSQHNIMANCGVSQKMNNPVSMSPLSGDRGSSAIIRFSLASYSAVLLPATLGYIFRT